MSFLFLVLIYLCTCLHVYLTDKKRRKRKMLVKFIHCIDEKSSLLSNDMRCTSQKFIYVVS